MVCQGPVLAHLWQYWLEGIIQYNMVYTIQYGLYNTLWFIQYNMVKLKVLGSDSGSTHSLYHSVLMVRQRLKHDLQRFRKDFSGSELVHWILHNLQLFENLGTLQWSTLKHVWGWGSMTCFHYWKHKEQLWYLHYYWLYKPLKHFVSQTTV